MPKLTIDVPETLMPLLTSKAEGWRETPEEFILNILTVKLQDKEEEPDSAMNSEDQERLEAILEERDKGPFVVIDDVNALRDRVMVKAMARLGQSVVHA